VVISINGLAGLKLRLVVPITGWKPAFASVPWLVQIDPSTQSGLTKSSVANPLQTRSLALERFNRKLGVLEAEALEDIVLSLGAIVNHPL
jgi:mRNA interferase MazF